MLNNWTSYDKENESWYEPYLIPQTEINPKRSIDLNVKLETYRKKKTKK